MGLSVSISHQSYSGIFLNFQLGSLCPVNIFCTRLYKDTLFTGTDFFPNFDEQLKRLNQWSAFVILPVSTPWGSRKYCTRWGPRMWCHCWRDSSWNNSWVQDGSFNTLTLAETDCINDGSRASARFVPTYVTIWVSRFTQSVRVLLRRCKGVINQQWSIVGVDNELLDPHWVQYSLPTEGEMYTSGNGLLCIRLPLLNIVYTLRN